MELELTFPTTELQGAFPASTQKLFKFLSPDTRHNDWIARRISQYGFIENQDYIIQVTYTGRRPRKEYFITLDMAKELCMVENNDKGKEARRYFIKCEKELQALKFQHYVNQISALEASNRLEAKHHQDQINGYLGKLAVVNKANEVLKAELIVARSKTDKSDQIQRLEAMLCNTRLDRDFYMKKYHGLQKSTKAKEHKAVLAIDAIQREMEHIFTAIGAVKSYINDGDEYFMENNELLKG